MSTVTGGRGYHDGGYGTDHKEGDVSDDNDDDSNKDELTTRVMTMMTAQRWWQEQQRGRRWHANSNDDVH